MSEAPVQVPVLSLNPTTTVSTLDAPQEKRLKSIERWANEQVEFNRQQIELNKWLRESLLKLLAETTAAEKIRETLDTEKLMTLLPRRFQCEHLPVLFEKESEKQARLVYNEGVVCYDRGEIDKAIELWSSAICIDRTYAPAWNNRSIAYSDKGDLDCAYHDYREAVKLGIER